MLKLNLAGEKNIMWKQHSIVKAIFILGSIYFFLSALISIVNYQYKFIYDGTSIVFHIANYEEFPPAAQREVFYLQQIIPVLLAKTSASLKSIMIGYVLNVYILFFIMFAFIMVYFKDAVSGILFLIVHYVGAPLNQIIMVEELLPGACFIIVLFSFYRNLNLINIEWKKYAIGSLIIFFIIRSHPLATLSLMASIPLVIMSDLSYFKKHFKTFAFLGGVFLLLMAQKFISLNDYDSGRLSEGKGFVESVTELLTPRYFMGMFYFLFSVRFFFTALFGLTIFYLFKNQKHIELFILTIMLFTVVSLFNMLALDLEDSNFYPFHLKYGQWTLPVRFVVFTAFCYLVLEKISPYRNAKLIAATSTVLFVLSLLHYSYSYNISKDYHVQVNAIIEKCIEENITKAIIETNELGTWPPIVNNAYFDILIFSSLNRDRSIQVVYLDEDESYDSSVLNNSEYLILQKGHDVAFVDELNDKHFSISDKDTYQFITLE
jgi:hypothetical protein